VIKRLLDIVRGPRRAEFAALARRVKNLENALDYAIDMQPWVASEEVGFNGQRQRKMLFQQLLETFTFDAIVETGTWLGNTTGYLASMSGLPVYTCESNRHFYALARKRLQHLENVRCSLDDSRSFLTRLSGTDLATQKVFFYLDAHFYEDLPLGQELEIVASRWRDFVIMVDDFAVPGDAGYGHDDYGGGKELCLDTYGQIFARNDLVPRFPASVSSEETGAKRGCVVLTRKGEWADRLGRLQSLRSSTLVLTA
jgi:hypothetical protein